MPELIHANRLLFDACLAVAIIAVLLWLALLVFGLPLAYRSLHAALAMIYSWGYAPAVLQAAVLRFVLPRLLFALAPPSMVLLALLFFFTPHFSNLHPSGWLPNKELILAGYVATLASVFIAMAAALSITLRRAFK
jgi:hypothetical protein